MPDAEIWEHNRLGDGEFRAIGFAPGIHIFIGQHQQEVTQVVGRATKPILETEHEGAGVLGLLHRQILQYRGQGIEQLEHGVLEASAARLLALFHEAGNGALALTQLGHRKTAQLVKPHHLRHRGEHDHGFEPIAVGGHGFHHLLGQIFNED